MANNSKEIYVYSLDGEIQEAETALQSIANSLSGIISLSTINRNKSQLSNGFHYSTGEHEVMIKRIRLNGRKARGKQF